MAATIRDITRATGLSVATVSKFLNGGHVLPENREKIERAVRALHYRVNEVARGLATSRTKTVGVLIPYLDNIFASTIIARVEDILRGKGYGTIVCDCRGDPAAEGEELDFLLSKQVDGVFNIPSSEDPAYLSRAADRGVPVVLIDRTFHGGRFDSVLADNAGASRSAVAALVRRGHRRIGILCGGRDSFTARERLAGYVEALRSRGISFRQELAEEGELSVRHGYDGMKKLLALKEPPTAVYLTNYEITLGAVVALNELGVRFPEDLSVIGFDNLTLAQVVRPRLWMVVQPMRQMAETAARVMLGRLDGSLQSPRRTYRLKTALVEGESVRRL